MTTSNTPSALVTPSAYDRAIKSFVELQADGRRAHKKMLDKMSVGEQAFLNMLSWSHEDVVIVQVGTWANAILNDLQENKASLVEVLEYYKKIMLATCTQGVNYSSSISSNFVCTLAVAAAGKALSKVEYCLEWIEDSIKEAHVEIDLSKRGLRRMNTDDYAYVALLTKKLKLGSVPRRDVLVDIASGIVMSIGGNSIDLQLSARTKKAAAVKAAAAI